MSFGSKSSQGDAEEVPRSKIDENRSYCSNTLTHNSTTSSFVGRSLSSNTNTALMIASSNLVAGGKVPCANPADMKDHLRLFFPLSFDFVVIHPTKAVATVTAAMVVSFAGSSTTLEIKDFILVLFVEAMNDVEVESQGNTVWRQLLLLDRC
mmetsp:Transcript_57917/g.117786  ORF Transcript_57917/g.117786 Transcript_57917/m.117786 type:complete len:152 (+) Transcript_57917:197-652(+)